MVNTCVAGHANRLSGAATMGYDHRVTLLPGADVEPTHERGRPSPGQPMPPSEPDTPVPGAPRCPTWRIDMTVRGRDLA